MATAKKVTAKKAATKRTAAKKSAANPKPDGPRLLAGDNPQIAKGEGDEPVQAWLDAIPGWKQDVARRLDALIVEAVPGVYKAVKWNTPFYGTEPGVWFLGMHCVAKYVKVTFFRGDSLDPIPPGTSTTPETRYYDVREGELDEAQFTSWVGQASRLPGERL